MHFQNAVRAIALRGGIKCKQALDRHTLGIERGMHIVFASQIHASSRLDEALGYLRIDCQVGSVVRNVEVCLDSRNLCLAYLKLRDLNRSRQLGIVQSSTSPATDGQKAVDSEVSLLYRLELGQLDSLAIEQKLITLILWVEDQVCLGRARRHAHVERRS